MTLEDLLEEIVGEIEDEFDLPDETVERSTRHDPDRRDVPDRRLQRAVRGRPPAGGLPHGRRLRLRRARARRRDLGTRSPTTGSLPRRLGRGAAHRPLDGQLPARARAAARSAGRDPRALERPVRDRLAAAGSRRSGRSRRTPRRRGTRPRRSRRTGRRRRRRRSRAARGAARARTSRPSRRCGRRPPVLPERVVRLRHEHGLEPARAVAVGAEHLELVQALHVERERALEPLISHWSALRRPSAKPRRLDRADRAVVELDRRLDRVVDPPARQERLHEARHRRDLADEEACEVDDVRPEVAERAGARLVGRGTATCRASGRRPSPGGTGRGSAGSRPARRPRASPARAAPPARSGS